MWHLIETNTSKSELIPEYWINSFSNILILENAIYSFSPDYEVSLILWKFLSPVHPNLASVAVVVLSCPAPSLFLGHGRSPTLFVDHHGMEEEKKIMERSIITNRKIQKVEGKTYRYSLGNFKSQKHYVFNLWTPLDYLEQIDCWPLRSPDSALTLPDQWPCMIWPWIIKI